MQSPYSRGIKKVKEEYLFPASPTLVNSLDIPQVLKDQYIQTRNKLLQQKENNTIQDRRLRPYQNQDVNFLSQLTQGKGVFNQQRTGKTPTTLVTMRKLNENKNLIFVPKSSVYKWIQEYKKWHGGPVYTTAPSWNKKRRIQAYEEFEGTLITNIDKADIDYDYLFAAFKRGDAIVLDEAHVLRTYTNNYSKKSTHSTFYLYSMQTNKQLGKYTSLEEAKANQREDTYLVENKKYNSAKVLIALIRLRKLFKDAYALTGTPVGNKANEIFGILAFLFPDLFTSYYPTMEYYFNIEQTQYNATDFPIKSIKGFKSKEKEQELLEFLETFSIQRKRKDVMPWLPKLEIEEIFLEPSPLQKRTMMELKTYFESGPIICENALGVMIALRQITSSPLRYNLEDLGPKFEWILDLISDYPERKYFIVSAFTEILKILKNIIPKKFKTALLEGRVNSLKRDGIVQAFQAGQIDILLGQIEVVSVSLTLSKASHLIFLDPSLVVIDNQQTEDRILPTTIEENINKEEQIITKLYINESIDTYIRAGLIENLNEITIINNYTKALKKEQK